MDYTVQGILQARILEWAAFPFSRGSPQPRDQTHISRASYTGRWTLYHEATSSSQRKKTKEEKQLMSPHPPHKETDWRVWVYCFEWETEVK